MLRRELTGAELRGGTVLFRSGTDLDPYSVRLLRQLGSDQPEAVA